MRWGLTADIRPVPISSSFQDTGGPRVARRRVGCAGLRAAGVRRPGQGRGQDGGGGRGVRLGGQPPLGASGHGGAVDHPAADRQALELAAIGSLPAADEEAIQERGRRRDLRAEVAERGEQQRDEAQPRRQPALDPPCEAEAGTTAAGADPQPHARASKIRGSRQSRCDPFWGGRICGSGGARAGVYGIGGMGGGQNQCA